MKSIFDEISDWGLAALSPVIKAFPQNMLIDAHCCLWKELQLALDGAPEVTASECLAQKQQLLKQYPGYRVNIEFLQCVIDQYPALLKGEISLLHLLFSGGYDTIVRLYESSPLAQYYNQLMAVTLAELMANNSCRILEIGAGIGATTAFMLPRVKAQCDLYIYTDISNAFITFGKRRFSKESVKMAYDMLNINRPHELPYGQIDFIVATDVLHNAVNIVESLAQMRQYLKPGGHLLISETTPKNHYATIIYGLTPAWWAFSDAKYRIPGSPLLRLVEWEKVLIAAGFVVSNILNDEPGQAIIVAQSIIGDFGS